LLGRRAPLVAHLIAIALGDVVRAQIGEQASPCLRLPLPAQRFGNDRRQALDLALGSLLGPSQIIRRAGTEGAG
jgi:hypothetical protein